MEPTPSTLILYHGNCPDGFGGAYAAWKKFGDTAEYRPMNYSKPLPEEVAGRDVYFIDFCYHQEIMDQAVALAKSVTVLDHHEGVEEVSTSMPNFVYDANRSGATIAWSYFHPDLPIPTLLKHVEDDDLFRFALPDTRPLLAYLAVHQPFTFEFWDALAGDLDDPARAETIFTKARAYREYFDLLVAHAAAKAELVLFEGHEVYLGQVHPMKPMVSALGHLLSTMKPPFALIAQIQTFGISVSMRGDGTIDLTEIAQKYGGNGHPSSAAFLIPWGTPFPWTPVEKDA